MVTKREREALVRRIRKIEERVAKKRDELRDCIADIEQIVDTVRDADDDFDGVLRDLSSAADHLDRHVVDKLSEYL